MLFRFAQLCLFFLAPIFFTGCIDPFPEPCQEDSGLCRDAGPDSDVESDANEQDEEKKDAGKTEEKDPADAGVDARAVVNPAA